ncbi:MAG: membrane protein [Chloroflexota bacterium]|nr:MAG: membrane protein [Chloroflexota bacterium]
METVDQITFILTLIAALTCGLIGGIFYPFSTFVMKALRRLPAEAGIAAMQTINITVITPWFLAPFLLAAVACIAVMAAALLRWHEPDSLFLLSGGALYLIGSFLVTFMFNVPRNEVLAAVAPADTDSAAYWAEYLSNWTFWNHIRTAAALAAAALLIIALVY